MVQFLTTNLLSVKYLVLKIHLNLLEPIFNVGIFTYLSGHTRKHVIDFTVNIPCTRKHMKYKKIESLKILEIAIYFMIKTICFRFTMNYNPRSILPYNSKESDIFMVSSTHIYIVQHSLFGAYLRAVQLFSIKICLLIFFYIIH